MMRRLHILDWMMHDSSHKHAHTHTQLSLSLIERFWQNCVYCFCVWNLMSSSELTLYLFFFNVVLIQYETSKKVGDKVVDFTVYDTSGNEKYTALAEEHMQSMYWITTTTREDSKWVYVVVVVVVSFSKKHLLLTHNFCLLLFVDVEGFFLIYSVTDAPSFQHLETLHSKVMMAKRKKNIPIVLVGNKCDLANERKISTQQGKDLADRFGCAFIETSAKGRVNIDEAFELLVQQVRQCREASAPANSSTKKDEKKKKDCSCQ